MTGRTLPRRRVKFPARPGESRCTESRIRGFSACPDEEGITTDASNRCDGGERFSACPDEEGITTMLPAMRPARCVFPRALMKKGLRPAVYANATRSGVFPRALMKKGLRHDGRVHFGLDAGFFRVP